MREKDVYISIKLKIVGVIEIKYLITSLTLLMMVKEDEDQDYIY